MKTIKNQKVAHRIARHRRIRAKVKGTATMPRLAVFRSNRFIVAQIIDDE
jgi:large subunit ribosomal protein L18